MAEAAAANRRYRCENCGYVFDPAIGCPDDDIAPGTAWHDLPADWLCPQCGSDQRDFSALD